MPERDEEQALSIEAILLRAEQLLPEYRRAIADMPREIEFKGIGASGMFFFFAAVRPFAPKQILESGRMRGESTLALARCFPEARIVSVEFDRHSKHAAIADCVQSATTGDLKRGCMWPNALGRY